jgi:zinc protease
MYRSKRAAAAALIAVSLSGCAAVKDANPLKGMSLPRLNPFKHQEKSGAPAPRKVPVAQRSFWTQQPSDVAPDPAVRTGKLPNGMRYAILKNATPPHQASVRLRIDAGALMETDDQTGVAHFLEHMAFNGSKNVPEGEMVKILERHGLAFGPDTNAFTSFDQTVYMLDLPEADDDTLDTGLMIMRETGGNLLLDGGAIDRERGVILSEERLRDTPGLRIARRQYEFFLKDQLAPKRFPIGKVEVIRAAPRERFTDFYNKYYRPDRATLVVTGDIDVDAVEAKIKARFGDWQASAPDGAQPNLGKVEPRKPETRVVVEPGGPLALQLAWINQPDLRNDQMALRRERLVRQLGFAVLNRRLGRLARGEKPPFIGAAAYRYTNVKSADITELSITAPAGGWSEALAATEQEQRRLVQYGVQQEEVTREITEMRAQLEGAVAGAATQRTPALASGIIDSIQDEQVYTSPAQDLEEFERGVKGLKAETVTAEIRKQFEGQGPLLFVTTPTPIEGGEAAVTAALDQSRQVAVAAPAAIVGKVWPYVDFGTPGAVADRKDVLDLDTTFVTFANGVKLTIKPTKLRDDQVLVSVRVGGGDLDLPKDRATPIWAAPMALPEGGLGKLTSEEIEQVLASNLYGISFSAQDEAFVLSGATRPQDFALQVQVLASYLTDAAWRPEPFERMRAYGSTLVDQMSSTPAGVFNRDGQRLLHSGDRRWGFPSRAEITEAKLADLKGLVQGPLSTAPIEVVIVGDVNVDTAIQEVRDTFGALPARAATTVPDAARIIRFPTGGGAPERLTHKGRADQGIAFVAWPTTDFPSDPQGARVNRMLEQVLQLRLVEEIREKQAVTYSPSTSLEAAWAFPGYGYISASIEAPPEKLDGFYATVREIVADLRDKPPSADELERARKPRIEYLLKAQATNEYWMGQLSGAQSDPRRLDAIRASIAGLQRVTPADVQRAAAKWLKDETAWRLEITPEASAAK